MKYSNVLLFLQDRTEALNDEVAVGIKSSIGWREITFRGLGLLSQKLASYLIKIGVNKGDKLAILSESMPEWGAGLFASVLSGAVTIPLDIKLTIYELTSILTDCQPKVLVVSNAYLKMAIELKETIASIEHIIILDDSGSNQAFPSLYNIPNEYEGRWRFRGMSKTAFIIYTSGTTGNPKGVEISFKNVMAQVDSVGKLFDFGLHDSFLSILPMNHLLELTVGFLTFLSKGTSIYYSQSLKPKDLFPIIQKKKITFMLVVPAFLKLLKSSIETEISKLSPFKKFMFKINYKIAKFIPFPRMRKLLFMGIHNKLGKNFRGCLVGGAPIELGISKFFERIGIIVVTGYGLSEASPVVASSTFKTRRLDSVGRPIPGVEVKIDKETGELLVKGDNVMKGYHNQPELTAEVIEFDGWLHTGDVGKIDKDGFVYITGRIKSMIVLSGGKKVFPEEVEDVLEKSPKFAEVCVFGGKKAGGAKDGSEDVFVAIVPSEEVLNSASNDEEINQIVRAEVKTLSLRLSTYKRPTNIIIAKEPFPRTSTRKVKKNLVKDALLK